MIEIVTTSEILTPIKRLSSRPHLSETVDEGSNSINCNDHRSLDLHWTAVVTPSSEVNSEDGLICDDHIESENHPTTVIADNHGTEIILGLGPVVAEITQLWRVRQSWHRAEKSLILQGKAKCRSWTEGDKEKASALFDAAADGKDVPSDVQMILMPYLMAIENFEPQRIAIEKRLKKLAQSLPVWTWVSGIKGFGPGNLAAIVGESGDLGNYRNPACLWKRMGMAVIDGERQRKHLNKDKAITHGYNPQRRSVAFLLGDCLIKKQSIYRTLYSDRKVYEATRVETKMHAHRRAARYMTKRVLRDLWVAWRRGSNEEGIQEKAA